MGVYIITSCLLEQIKEKIYLTEILLPFTQQNNLRVGIDKENRIIDKYLQIAQNNPGIASWLNLMSYEPESFERISIPEKYPNVDCIELYLKVCKHFVQQNKVIVYTHQSLKDFKFIESNIIEYEGARLNVYDRDEAISELKPVASNTHIERAVIVSDNSRAKNINL